MLLSRSDRSGPLEPKRINSWTPDRVSQTDDEGRGGGWYPVYTDDNGDGGPNANDLAKIGCQWAFSELASWLAGRSDSKSG